MTKNVGMAKAGTGGLVSLLKNSNPTLLKQIQATKGSAEAFDLLMQAAHDTADPMKRNTLLAAAFGDSGVTLARIAELGAKQFREEAKQGDVLAGRPRRPGRTRGGGLRRQPDQRADGADQLARRDRPAGGAGDHAAAASR